MVEEEQDKKKFNAILSKYFYRLSEEYEKIGMSVRAKTIFGKANRISDCLNFAQWDEHDINTLLDLQKVNRCKDNRFCPNCKRFSLAFAIYNLSKPFKSLLDDGYYPYLLTLTVPNCRGDDLRNTIDAMNKAFTKFYYMFSKDDRHAFKGRYLKFEAALKVLEITYNNKTGMYHPHFHVMIFSKEYYPDLFNKDLQAEYSLKRKSYDMVSKFDMQIRKLWYMAYNRIPLAQYSVLSDTYICDIKEMDSNGISEVLKYTFRNTDIKNYNNFKYIFLALEGKRIRQGYGKLYNCKVD